MTKLVLCALLRLRQPVNDIGGTKIFEEVGERNRLVIFQIEPPKDFNVNGKLGDQLKPLSQKYADALAARPEFVRIHVL